MEFKSLLICLSVFVSLVLTSSSVKQEPLQHNLLIEELYPTSVHYQIKSNSSPDTDVICSFFDGEDDTPLTCNSLNSLCPCKSGIINNLKPNTIYDITVKKNEEILISSEKVQTASEGTITLNFGLDFLSYEIAYRKDEIKPTLCSASVGKKEPIIDINAVDGCLSGLIDGLTQNTNYELTVYADKVPMHSRNMITNYFNINVTATGLNAFTYLADTDLISTRTECVVYDINSSEVFNCNGSKCDCLGSSVTNLESDHQYNLGFKQDGNLLTVLIVTTASTGVISSNVFYNGISYSVEYAHSDTIPSNCYSCSYDQTDSEMSLDQCDDYFFQGKLPEVSCEEYKHDNLAQSHKYTTVLFDGFGATIGCLKDVTCPKSVIISTTYQLTSISYKLDSQLKYEPTSPCYILDKEGSKRHCLVNGVETTECECLEGKIVDLPIDSLIFLEIYQDNTLLAVETAMYTAGIGSLTVLSVGLHFLEYKIVYPQNTHSPLYCKTCPLPDYKEGQECSIGLASGEEICTSSIFYGLQTKSQYQIKIYDGDIVPFVSEAHYTSGYPTSSSFVTKTDRIVYQLSYSDSKYIPTGCKFFFVENLESTAECGESKCDCEKGSVLIPAGKNYKKLVILDAHHDTLVKSFDDFQELSTASIIGICIGGVVAIMLFVLVITTTMFFNKKWNQDGSIMKENDEDSDDIEVMSV